MNPRGDPVVRPSPDPLKIFVDLEGHEYWYRRELEALFSSLVGSSEAVLATSRSTADCVLQMEGAPQLKARFLDCYRRGEPEHPRRFVWDSGDLPTGAMAGLYVSLPSYMHDRRRHRAFCLPIRCAETVRAYDISDATHLYGFFGAISSGLRARMAAILRGQPEPQRGLIEIRDSIWHQMFDRSGLRAKQDYAESLRRCRFNLCPRGSVLAGTGSRLYETMQAARVPVIISDWMTLPEGVDWNSCSVRVKERDLARIPQILESYSEQWPSMAHHARREWEAHFSEEALLGELGRQIRPLLAWKHERSPLNRVDGALRISLGLLSWNCRQLLTRVQRLRRLARKSSGS